MDTLNKLIKTLVPTKESKEKKYEELWNKIGDLIRSVTKKSDDFDANYINIKLDWDDKLPLNKRMEITVLVIVVRAIFMTVTNIIHKFS